MARKYLDRREKLRDRWKKTSQHSVGRDPNTNVFGRMYPSEVDSRLPLKEGKDFYGYICTLFKNASD